jgi:hypothetical protein
MNQDTHDRLILAGFTDQDIERGWKYHQAQGTPRKEWDRYMKILAQKLTGAV